MSHKNSKREIKRNQKKLDKGEKFYCSDCWKRSDKKEASVCLAHIIDCEDSWYSRECEYKKCSEINRYNNCLEFDKTTYCY